MKRLVILTTLVSLGALFAPSAAGLASERPPGRPILAKPAHEDVLRVADTTSPTTGEKKGEKKGGKGTTTTNPAASGKAPAGAPAAAATVKPKPKGGATTPGAVAGSSRPTATSSHGSGLPPGVPQGAVMVPGSAGNPPTYVMPNTGGSEQYQSNGAGQYERVKPPAGIQ